MKKKQIFTRCLQFKDEDDVAPGFVGCVKLDQIGVVQLVHDLNLIFHHILPKQAEARGISVKTNRVNNSMRLLFYDLMKILKLHRYFCLEIWFNPLSRTN